MDQLIQQYSNIDIFLLLRVVLEEFKDEIAELNRKQLLSGNRADGTSLPAYTDAYARRKGKSLTPKTLKDTGNFHDGFDSVFFKDYFEMFSRDWKGEILIHNWGEEIHGLTEQSKSELLPKVSEKLASYIIQRK
ncbi:MAG: hypothetical protein ACOC10_09460 [Bacteroidota bacterium]